MALYPETPAPRGVILPLPDAWQLGDTASPPPAQHSWSWGGCSWHPRVPPLPPLPHGDHSHCHSQCRRYGLWRPTPPSLRGPGTWKAGWGGVCVSPQNHMSEWGNAAPRPPSGGSGTPSSPFSVDELGDAEVSAARGVRALHRRVVAHLGAHVLHQLLQLGAWGRGRIQHLPLRRPPKSLTLGLWRGLLSFHPGDVDFEGLPTKTEHPHPTKIKLPPPLDGRTPMGARPAAPPILQRGINYSMGAAALQLHLAPAAAAPWCLGTVGGPGELRALRVGTHAGPRWHGWEVVGDSEPVPCQAGGPGMRPPSPSVPLKAAE